MKQGDTDERTRYDGDDVASHLDLEGDCQRQEDEDEEEGREHRPPD